MGRSNLFSVLLIAILIGSFSSSACSQIKGDSVQITNSQAGTDRDKNGKWVTVDGERVFVPQYYLSDDNPLRSPEKVARDIVRGRKVIRDGKATSAFVPSIAGTEMAVDMIEFEPHEPQTRPAQIAYVQERVKVFNALMRDSELPINDTVAGTSTASLIALKMLGDGNPLGEAKRRQQQLQERIFADEAYQGRADAEKQSTYEWIAFFAVEAMNELKRAKSARTAGEREAAQKKSRGYAEIINSFVLTGQLPQGQ